MNSKTWFKSVLLGIFFWSLFVGLSAASLKFVKSFGSGSDDFLFRTIMGAAFGPNKDIYVTDVRGHFLARYDWNGTLIKKIGQRGQGPTDFNAPKQICIFNNKLYCLDLLNARIAETDLKLENLKYHKIQSGEKFQNDFHMIGPSKCVGDTISYSVDFQKEYKRMKFLNFETQWSDMFFDRVPVKGLSPRQILKNGLWPIFFGPCSAVDLDRKQVIVSFVYPNEPIEYFIYSFDGQYIERFDCTFDKSYKLAEYVKNGGEQPKRYLAHIQYSIFVYKDLYISFLGKVSYKGRESDEEPYCLIIDRNTKTLKARFKLPEKSLDFYSISEDGYLVGTQHYQDETKVHVYKLEL